MWLWAGCTSQESVNSEFRVSFACEADREAADTLSLSVLRGGCTATETVYGARLQKGGKAPTLPTLEAGVYGFAAEASRGGVVLASGCSELKLPNKKGASVELRSEQCKAGGLADAGEDELDAGAGDGDGGSRDGSSGDAGCPGPGCDDGNPCTEYVCTNAGCELVLLTLDKECDGIACTENDRCVQGQCITGTANDTLCDDDNPCTAEECVPAIGCNRTYLDGTACDDGASCSQDDACLHGRCWGQSTCASPEVCDRASGACVSCTSNAQCDDNDPCTEDLCSCQDEACTGGVCSHVAAADNTACDDGIACTTQDLCVAGVCKGSADSERCDDQNTCTDDVCEPGVGCRFVPAERSCDDFLDCTDNDRCIEGACVGQVACEPNAFCGADGRCVMCEVDADCVDASSTQCLVDTCVLGTCVRSVREGPCDDNIACTIGDTCVDGVCKSGTPDDTKCVDSDQCTADKCDPVLGCTHRLAALDCDDGVSCTTGDKCFQGACRGQNACGQGLICLLEEDKCVTCLQDSDCDDGRECTSDRCLGGVCQHTSLTGTRCNDGIACSVNDTCVAGECVGTPDDGLCPSSGPCITGSCVAGVGCTTTYSTDSCDDGRACTSNDTCVEGQCVGNNTCPSGAVCQTSGCICTGAGETLCGNTCANLATSNQHCGECGYACGSGKQCVEGACRPTSAPAQCVASRWRGHDYLVCNDATYNWNQARTRCRNFGMDLAIITDAAENNHIRTLAAGQDRWIGANDKGTNGSNCTRSGQEGQWRWVEPVGGGLNGTVFCQHANSNASTCSQQNGMYVNWASGEPNNSGCGSCPFFGIGSDCSEGEDCGMILANSGQWNDGKCGSTSNSDKRYYICESY